MQSVSSCDLLGSYVADSVLYYDLYIAFAILLSHCTFATKHFLRNSPTFACIKYLVKMNFGQSQKPPQQMMTLPR